MQGFDLSTVTNITLGATGVNSVYLGSTLIWPTSPPVHDYSRDYLTIVSGANNNDIIFTYTGLLNGYDIYVSTDNGTTWTQKTSSSSGTVLATLNNGEKLLLKGSHEEYGLANNGNTINATYSFDIEGNIMSLIYNDNFIGQTSLLGGSGYEFAGLFKNSNIVNAENLCLAATTLDEACYKSMFYRCSNLITAPALPATTLHDHCYDSMFYQCSSLTTPPALPATSLCTGCYKYMFLECTSLTTAPALPATTFGLGEEYDSMFYGCTSLTTAPILPATTLTDSCYRYMFYNCTSLNSITCLATDISATNCTYFWLYNVASTGTFYKDANMSNWTSGSSGIPSGWTVQDYQ